MKFKPFEKTTVSKLWNDDTISKNMLKHHLSFEDNIASRRYTIISKTVNFLINKYHLNTSSSVCDLGCGPGLYTNLFQKAGIYTTGIDFSENSISYAKKTNPEVNYILGNYLEVETNEKYNLITMIYCDFCVLSNEQVNQLLKNIKKHLKKDGIFFFDVHHLDFFSSVKESTHKTKEVDGFYMSGESDITYTTYKYYHDKLILNHIVAKGIREVELFNWLQCYSIDSIKEVLKNNGFELLEVFTSTYGNDGFNDNSFTVSCKIKGR